MGSGFLVSVVEDDDVELRKNECDLKTCRRRQVARNGALHINSPEFFGDNR